MTEIIELKEDEWILHALYMKGVLTYKEIVKHCHDQQQANPSIRIYREKSSRSYYRALKWFENRFFIEQTYKETTVSGQKISNQIRKLSAYRLTQIGLQHIASLLQARPADRISKLNREGAAREEETLAKINDVLNAQEIPHELFELIQNQALILLQFLPYARLVGLDKEIVPHREDRRIMFFYLLVYYTLHSGRVIQFLLDHQIKLSRRILDLDEYLTESTLDRGHSHLLLSEIQKELSSSILKVEVPIRILKETQFGSVMQTDSYECSVYFHEESLTLKVITGVIREELMQYLVNASLRELSYTMPEFLNIIYKRMLMTNMISEFFTGKPSSSEVPVSNHPLSIEQRQRFLAFLQDNLRQEVAALIGQDQAGVLELPPTFAAWLHLIDKDALDDYFPEDFHVKYQNAIKYIALNHYSIAIPLLVDLFEEASQDIKDRIYDALIQCYLATDQITAIDMLFNKYWEEIGMDYDRFIEYLYILLDQERIIEIKKILMQWLRWDSIPQQTIQRIFPLGTPTSPDQICDWLLMNKTRYHGDLELDEDEIFTIQEILLRIKYYQHEYQKIIEWGTPQLNLHYLYQAQLLRSYIQVNQMDHAKDLLLHIPFINNYFSQFQEIITIIARFEFYTKNYPTDNEWSTTQLLQDVFVFLVNDPNRLLKNYTKTWESIIPQLTDVFLDHAEIYCLVLPSFIDLVRVFKGVAEVKSIIFQFKMRWKDKPLLPSIRQFLQNT